MSLQSTSTSASGIIYKNLKIENRLDVLPSGHIVTSSKGDILTDNGTKSVTHAVGNNGQVLTVSSESPTGLVWSTAGPDTITNIGGGTGIFKQKTDNNFELKSILCGTTMSVTSTDNTIALNVIPANIDIQRLENAPISPVVGISDSQTLTNKKWGDDLDMENHKIINMSLPTSDNDAVNKKYVDDITTTLIHDFTNNFKNKPDSTVVRISDDQTLTNKKWGDNLDINGHSIVNLSAPVNSNDAANKQYVDRVVSSLDVKLSVKVSTTDDLSNNESVTDVVYANINGNNNNGQIFAILTTPNSFIVDNVTLTSNNNGARILLKNQLSSDQNGIWLMTIDESLLTLDRAVDFDNVTTGTFIFVEEGTINASCGWVLINNNHNPITIGGESGTPLTFSQFSRAGQIIAGSGLVKNGNELSVVGSKTITTESGVFVNSSSISNQVLMSSGTVGIEATFGAVHLDDTNAVTGILTVSHGGTGALSFEPSKIIASNADASCLTVTALDPLTVVTLDGEQTLVNKIFDSSNIFTSPKIKTSIKDVNNNNLLEVTPVDNAVNSLSISNAVSGTNPTISVNGEDDDIDLNLTAKGSGHIKISNLAYPSNDGTANQVLTTNGSGFLGFTSVPTLRVATGTTIDATPLVLSDLTIATTNNTVYLVEAKIVARRSDNGEEGAGFIVRGTFKNSNNILSEIKNGTMYLGEGKPVWVVSMNVDGTNITITVTGEDKKTIQWGGNVNVTSI